MRSISIGRLGQVAQWLAQESYTLKVAGSSPALTTNEAETIRVMTKTELQILKAMRRDRRAEEIALHGKLVSFRHTIARSKKQYTRKSKHKSRWHE